ncbi:MAG: carbon monoxide dehydrogenase [Oscillospiraceae bacterium]|nr:carbon monoxide dehydrogenase [Oscillospiraceae bacterium]
MELFNSLIKETNDLLNGITPKSYPYIPSKAWKDIGSNELVLSRDAAFELGASGKGSANYVLFTSSGDLVEKDEICVYGRDINAISSDSDFARIVILRVGALEMEDEAVYRTLKDIEFSKYHVYPEGYMVRMSSENYREQVRISKQAVRRGISFEALGNNYITEYKKNLNVLAVKVMFITDPAPDYRKMQEIAKKSKEVTETLTHIFEGLSTDCSVCSLKDVCDEVEGMKELHFGIGAKGINH